MQEKDPIVDEVRAIRDAIAKEYDYDVAKIAEAMREKERTSGRKYVTLPPRKPVDTRKAG